MSYPHISPTTPTGLSGRFLSSPLHDMSATTWRAGSASAAQWVECVLGVYTDSCSGDV